MSEITPESFEPQGEHGVAGERVAIGLALEDALCELVHIHGIEYLDTFLQRRLRRTLPQLQLMVDASPPQFRQQQEQIVSGAETALRRMIDAVRSNPSRVD